MGTDGSVRVKRVGRAALRRSIPQSVAPLSSFRPVSPDSETRIGTAAAPGVDRSCHRSPARILGQGPWDHDCPATPEAPTFQGAAAADSCRISVSAQMWLTL